MTTGPRPRHRCRFCGKAVGYPTKHEDACLSNPPVRERTRIDLDDGTGTIRKFREYSPRQGGVCRKSLLLTYHSWAAVAAAFGLRLYQDFGERHPEQAASIDRALSRIGQEIDAARERDYLLRDYGLGLPVLRVIETPAETVYVLR